MQRLLAIPHSMEIDAASTIGINRALDVLRQGGIVAHATETCYGLACDLTNPDAVARLFELKRRPRDQPVSALFASIEDAKKYVKWNDRAEELAQKHLPGPLTLILPLRNDAPYALFPVARYRSPVANGQRATGNGQQTVGIRVSSHPIAMELALRFGKPLSTTSANVHGKPNLYNVEDIEIQFSILHAQFSILILDSGILPKNPPSTIIDLTKPDQFVVRKGNVEIE